MNAKMNSNNQNNRRSDYMLYKTSATSDVLIFRRNNLDVNSFTQTDDGWSYSEGFNFHGRWCIFKIAGPGRIKDYFPTEESNLVIKGGFHTFGIQIKFTSKQDPPFREVGSCGGIRFSLECRGRKRIAKKGKDRRYIVPMERGKPKSQGPIEYETTAWSVAHPYQGGGSTPR